jgi:hypothetical protein
MEGYKELRWKKKLNTKNDGAAVAARRHKKKHLVQ